ncbi:MULTISPECIES: DUF2788 domain-containing protein [unclassified Moritella]|jgi:hypothetical protein|uniref:DUF2788 domain-containing protein n=1 Tax=unclassified Moritella TaxID=2637987 RepID=UPI001BA5F72C|nr:MULTISPECIES: DUF2788 domain-containing protein [unclassified Moritella]QUM79979.1 DUF2788 domain-containing protein [Moritella sp. 5]QUM84229.1 DUF2788 domain-containing protein [Moritella sp. 28]QUM88530.1 DUF2788 domain-containing protein [Moritella sp. 36]
MLYEYIDLIESVGTKLFFVALFFLIGMAIHDVLKKGNVPQFGRVAVWFVLCFGMAGFVFKEVLITVWETQI